MRVRRPAGLDVRCRDPTVDIADLIFQIADAALPRELCRRGFRRVQLRQLRLFVRLDLKIADQPFSALDVRMLRRVTLPQDFELRLGRVQLLRG